jgi:hypothetical protein
LWSTDASGRVATAGVAARFGRPAAVGSGDPVVGIAATPGGSGAWLATRSGRVVALGDAPAPPEPDVPHPPVVAIAAAPDGRGCWLVTADGSVVSVGDAPFRGTAIYQPPRYPYNVVLATPGPAAGIVASAGRGAGYWVFGTTGRVVGRGRALTFGGDNNLAMFTP